MAMTERVDGQYAVGNPKKQCIFFVDSKAGTASAIGLLDSSGFEHFLWFDVDGTLRTGSRTDLATPDSAGTIIGTQS
jgi:hypothetical protein